MDQNLSERIRVHLVQVLPQRYRTGSQLPASKSPSLTPVLNQTIPVTLAYFKPFMIFKSYPLICICDLQVGSFHDILRL